MELSIRSRYSDWSKSKSSACLTGYCVYSGCTSTAIYVIQWRHLSLVRKASDWPMQAERVFFFALRRWMNGQAYVCRGQWLPPRYTTSRVLILGPSCPEALDFWRIFKPQDLMHRSTVVDAVVSPRCGRLAGRQAGKVGREGVPEVRCGNGLGMKGQRRMASLGQAEAGMQPATTR